MGQSTPLHKEFVLLVEDDALQRDFMAELLEDAGLNVLCCSTAECAIATMQATGFQIRLLITDDRLSGAMDGSEMARLIRRGWPRTHVVVVSSWNPESDLPAGVSFLRKPWWPQQLLEEVHRGLGEVGDLAPAAGRSGIPIISSGSAAGRR